GHRVLGQHAGQLVGTERDREEILRAPSLRQPSTSGRGDNGRAREQQSIDSEDHEVSREWTGVVPAIRVGLSARTLGYAARDFSRTAHGRPPRIGTPTSVTRFGTSQSARHSKPSLAAARRDTYVNILDMGHAEDAPLGYLLYRVAAALRPEVSAALSPLGL